MILLNCTTFNSEKFESELTLLVGDIILAVKQICTALRNWQSGALLPLTVRDGAATLKVHKNENFFGFDVEFCTISLLVTLKY